MILAKGKNIDNQQFDLHHKHHLTNFLDEMIA